MRPPRWTSRRTGWRTPRRSCCSWAAPPCRGPSIRYMCYTPTIPGARAIRCSSPLTAWSAWASDDRVALEAQMNVQKICIHLLVLISIALVTVLLTRSTTDARHQAVRRVLLALFALVTAAAILFPAIVGRVAELVGVGRGTDLLLYLLVIAFLSFIATSLRRVKMLD